MNRRDDFDPGEPRNAQGEWTNGGGVAKSRNAMAGKAAAVTERRVKAVFGDDFKVEDAIRALGDHPDLPPGTVRITPAATTSTGEHLPDGAIQVEYEADSKDKEYNYTISRIFYRENGALVVHHDLFTLPKAAQGKGIAKSVLRKQVEQEQRLGVQNITLDAAWDGKAVWPKLGFRTLGGTEGKTIKMEAKPSEILERLNDQHSAGNGRGDGDSLLDNERRGRCAGSERAPGAGRGDSANAGEQHAGGSLSRRAGLGVPNFVRPPVGTSFLYARLGRKPPKPGPAREPPPRGRILAAAYSQRLQAIVRAWYDHVETIGRHELGSRTDATFQEQLEDAFDRLLQASGLDAFLARKAKMVINKQAAYVKRITKIPPANLSTAQLIEDYRRANAGLITGMKADQVERVTSVLRRAQSQGQRWEETAPEIKSTLGIGLDRARLIARDQTNKFNGSMMQLTQQSAGIDEYTWSTTKQPSVRGFPGGPNTRKNGANHYALEGTRHSWADPPLIPNTEDHAHPGQQVLCECVAIPVIPYFE